MRTLLIVALVALALAPAPPAAADHIECADPDDPVTGAPCLFVVALLNCASHRLEGVPCRLP